MNPEDNSLESGYDASAYNSSLEGKPGEVTTAPAVATVPGEDYKPKHLNISLFRFNKIAALLTVTALTLILLIGGGLLIYDKFHNNSKTPAYNSEEANGTYKVGSNLSVGQANSSQLLQLGQASQIQINGQLTVNKNIVLTPTSAPSSPVPGEIYFNKANNQPYYYNGSSFVTLVPTITPQSASVTSLGGTSGIIGLGSSLALSGGTLNVSNSVLKSLSALQNTPVVNSLQGLTGAVSLSAGTGISINGPTITNSGVVSLSSSNGSIVITDNGNGNYNIALASLGGVLLAPGAAQIDASANPSIYINKTGSGDLLNLESNGQPSIVVNNGGQLTASDAVSFNGGATSDSLDVTGATTLSGAATAASTFNVQGGFTVGIPGSTAGNIYLSNTNNPYTIDLTALAPSGTANATIQLPTIVGGATDIVCLQHLANCGSSSNTVTTSSAGTSNDIAKFTGVNQIADSSITDNGTQVTIGELLAASTISTSTIQSIGALNITPGSTLTIGVNNQILSLVGAAGSTLSVQASGFTSTLGFAAPTANQTITVPNATGTICLDNSPSCGFSAGGSGVTSLDTISGALTINDSSGTGTTITIQPASTTAPGIAQFSSSDFQVLTGNIIDTIQGITTSSNVQFGSLALDYGGACAALGDLCLGNNGTVYATNYTNQSTTSNLTISGGSQNVSFSNDSGANTFIFPTTGGLGQTICTSGITCASGGGQAVILQPSSEQSDTGSSVGIYINDTTASGTADLLQLQTSGANALVVNSSGDTTLYNTAYTNNLQPIAGGSGIAIGNPSSDGTNQLPFTLQGNSSSEIALTNANGGTSYIGIADNTTKGAASATSVYYALDDSQVAPSGNSATSPIYICTSANSYCTSSSSITGTGVTNDIAYFTGSQTLASSIISQASTSSILIEGNLTFSNSTNSYGYIINQLSVPSASVTLDLPTTSGTFAVSAQGPLSLNATTGVLSCPTCDSSGGGGTAAVQSLDSLTGTLTIADSTGSASTVTIQSALTTSAVNTTSLGLVEINNDGNLTDTSGLIDTAQGITTTSSPTFDNLTLQGTTGLTVGSTSNDGIIRLLDGTTDGFSMKFNQATLTSSQAVVIPNASGTLAVDASGNLSESAAGSITITNAPTFSTSVTTPLIDGSSGLTITPGGLFTAGSTTAQFVLQGSSTSTISATSTTTPTDTTTLSFATPTATNTITIPNVSGTICLTSNNCNFQTSGSYILNQTTAQSPGNIDIVSTSSAVAATIEGAASQDIMNLLSSSAATVAYFNSVGSLYVTSNDINGATITGGALSGSTLSSTGLTFSGSTDSITGPTNSPITIDTTGSAALDLGNANATTITLGNASSATTLAGTFTESYSSSTASTINGLTVTNSNTGAGVTIQGYSLTPTNTATPSSGTNTLNLFNFAAGAALGTGDITNGINFASATGYTNFINSSTNFKVNSGGNISLNLGTAGTSSNYVCMNGYMLSSCPTSGANSGAAFIQGGNSFGALAVLGTNDANNLQINIDTFSRATFAANGIDLTGSGESYQIDGVNAYALSSTGGNAIINTNLTVTSAGQVILAGSLSGGDIVTEASGTYANNIKIQPGSSSSALQGGALILNGGSNSTGNWYGGPVEINGGASTATSGSGIGGGVSIQGGNSSSSTGTGGSVDINSGTGATYGLVNINTSGSGGTVIGSSGGGNVSLYAGTSNDITIGGNANNTIDIGAVGIVGDTTFINIGTSSGANQSIVIGSTSSASSLQLQAGGGITVNNSLINQTYTSSTAGTLSLLGQTATNANTSSLPTTVNAINLTLQGASNSFANSNVLNGINFNNVAAATNNTFNGLNFGTGYTNYINSNNFIVSANGNVKDQTLFNSTTAFQVQNAASSNLIQVDTLNSVVDLGSVNSSYNSTVNIADNNSGYIQTVNIGSTNNSSSTTIKAGSNNLNLITTGQTIAESQTNSLGAFQIQNSSGSALLSADTVNSRVGIGPISSPSGLSATAEPGGTLPANSYFIFEVVGVDSAGGQTAPSTQTAVIETPSTCPTSGDCSIDILWTNLYAPGAIGYRIYVDENYSGFMTYVPLPAGSDSYNFSSTSGLVSGSPQTMSNAFVNQLAGSATGTNYLTDTVIQTETNPNTAFQIQNAAGTSIFTGDTTNNRIDINGGGYTSNNATSQFYVGGKIPQEVGTGSTQGAVADVSVKGNYAYVIDYCFSVFGSCVADQGLFIYNVSNPSSPVEVGAINTFLFTLGSSLYVNGNYAYVVSGEYNTLYIFNISNPSSPTLVSSSTSGLSYPQSVYVQGNYAYVVNYDGNNLEIFNVSNPSNPVEVVSDSTGLSGPQSIYVQGNYAYVTSLGNNQLVIFNVSNPSSPTEMPSSSVTQSTDLSRNIYVSGGYAYIVGNNTLYIFNISNPSSPTLVSSSGSGLSSPESVYVQGRYAYVTNGGNNNVVVYDISNPSSPVEIGVSSTTGLNEPGSIYVQGRYAYVGNYNIASIAVLDLGGSYIQQLQTGGIETGSINVDNNANINGDLALQGALTVGTNTELQGNLGVNGSALFSNSTNSPSAFQVQNASGANLLNVDTTNTKITVGQGNLVVMGLGSPTGVSVSAGSNSGGSLSGSSSTTYYYKVSAINSAGETLPSPEVSISGSSFTPISAPAQNVPTIAATSGGSLATGTYYYKITALTANGQTIGSNEESIAVTSPDTVGLSWTAVTGAASYDVYRGTTSGGENVYYNTTATSYTDTGAAGTSGSVPTPNTATTNTNEAVISWSPVIGATSYRVYRGTTSGGENVYYNTTATSYTDTGAAGSTSSPQTSDQTARLGIGTSSPSANLDVLGNTTLQTPVNSTLAFQVQNAAGTSILTVDTSNQRVDIGTGTGVASPVLLVLDTGNSATDPTEVNGAMYYNSADESFRCGVNGVWRSCSGGLVNSDTAASTAVSNTATETDFSGGTNNQYTMLANDCQPGVVYNITASGVYSDASATTPTLTFDLTLNGTTTNILASGALATGSGVTNSGWQVTAQLICDTSGASGTLEAQGNALVSTTNGTAGTGANVGIMSNSTTQSINTTTANTLGLGVTWGTASTSNTIQMRQFIVQRIGP
ncbi:MAG: hypothetical protein ACYCPS_03245 [Candidatus Saccharimonadales bacterium]